MKNIKNINCEDEVIAKKIAIMSDNQRAKEGRCEIVKREFIDYLEHVVGLCIRSWATYYKSIELFDTFTEYKPYQDLDVKTVKGFKEFLRDVKRYSLSSRVKHIRNMRRFFDWLSKRKGWKSIDKEAIEYFQLGKKEVRIADNRQKIVAFPTLQDVIQITDCIESDTEVGLRDRALIAFAVQTGLRESTIASLNLGSVKCLHSKCQYVHADPKTGVDTKFSKSLIAKIWNFDEMLSGYIHFWYAYLKGDKDWKDSDPLFPQALRTQINDGIGFAKAVKVEPVFWKSGGIVRDILRKRSKQAGVKYFPPHTYRHLAVTLALEKAKNGMDIKAISQSFGHDYVSTTFNIYGNLTPNELRDRLMEIDPTGYEALKGFSPS